MKEIEIEYSGLKVKHLVSVANINENNTVKEKADILSAVYEVDKATLYRLSTKDFGMLWDTLLRQLKEVAENAELRKVIEVDGKQYKLINIERVPVGWVIDYSELAATGINPEDIMALCYIDNDLANYMDENNDLLRRKDIMLNADLSDYIALSKFFFAKLERLSRAMEKLIQMETLRRKPFRVLWKLGFGSLTK